MFKTLISNMKETENEIPKDKIIEMHESAVEFLEDAKKHQIKFDNDRINHEFYT